MSCESCKDIEEKDGVAPQCGVCLIPPLSPDEARVLEMRAMLISLNELGIGSEILKIFEATKEDLEMLGVVEEEIKEARDGRSENHNFRRG